MECHLYQLLNFLVGEESKWQSVNLNFNLNPSSNHTKLRLETSCLVIGMRDGLRLLLPDAARYRVKNVFKIEPFFFPKEKKNLRLQDRVLFSQKDMHKWRVFNEY